MKIEKLNDNQIRCTLNKKDLMDRQLRLSELAYGTERAKDLFRDMMQQASAEFGFEAEDIPLMIEATPISGESLVLIITKLEDPDELDTRFSRFTNEQEETASPEQEHEAAYADEVLNCFDHINDILKGASRKLHGSGEETAGESEGTTEELLVHAEELEEDDEIQINLTKVYSFRSLEEVIRLSGLLVNFYHGINSVYKDTAASVYYLMIEKSDHTPEEFNKICNMITEYGTPVPTTYATCDYITEHCEAIVKNSGIQILSVM